MRKEKTVTNPQRSWVMDTTVGVNMQTVYLIETESGESVARVHQKADAILILSSPRLLTALENCVKEMGTHLAFELSTVRQKAKEALAMAKGADL